jgi:hypothetical protein
MDSSHRSIEAQREAPHPKARPWGRTRAPHTRG